MSYEAENWYILSYDQYFPKKLFFFISVAVPSIYQKELLAQANKYFKEKNLEIKVASRYQLYQGCSWLYLPWLKIVSVNHKL